MLVGGSGGNISLAQVQAEAQREMMKSASEDKKCSRVARNDQFQKHTNMRQQAIEANAEKADKGFLGTLMQNIGLVVGIIAAAIFVACSGGLAAPIVALVGGLILAGGGAAGKLTSAFTAEKDAADLEKQASELELEATKMQKESEDWGADVQAKQDIIRQSIEVSRTALQNDLKACERVVERS
jgi:hypothetical protein